MHAASLATVALSRGDFMAKRVAPEIAGLIAGFSGSIVFLAVMLLVPVTVFMRIMQLAMPFMPQINFFGWTLHAITNSFWGFLFAIIVEKWKIRKLFAAALVWSLLLLGLILLAVPLVGLEVTSKLIMVELFAHINLAIVLWAVYSTLTR